MQHFRLGVACGAGPVGCTTAVDVDDDPAYTAECARKWLPDEVRRHRPADDRVLFPRRGPDLCVRRSAAAGHRAIAFAGGDGDPRQLSG